MPKPELLSQNELKEIRIDVEHNRLDYPHRTAKLLLDHIDAQAALLAEREKQANQLATISRQFFDLLNEFPSQAHYLFDEHEVCVNKMIELRNAINAIQQQEQPHAD